MRNVNLRDTDMRKAARFKLIAADLDGTLLDNTHRITPELLRAVDRARTRGVRLVVATGRMYPSALRYIEELDIKLPVIAANGAVVKDPVTGEIVSQTLLSRDLALEVLKLTENTTAQRFVVIRDVFYTDAPREEVRRYSEALGIKFVNEAPLEQVVTEDPLMITIRDHPDRIAPLTGKLREVFGSRVYLVNSKPVFIDINNPRVSKGAALTALCEKLGVRPQEVVAIGDGWNDREMFAAAGLGAAVANAPVQLKEHAGYVCEHENFRGVIEVIEKFILSGTA